MLETFSEKGEKYTKVKANGYIYWIRPDVMRERASKDPGVTKLYHESLTMYADVVYFVWDRVVVKQRWFESNEAMLDFMLEKCIDFTLENSPPDL